jgi:hypothetical protein
MMMMMMTFGFVQFVTGIVYRVQIEMPKTVSDSLVLVLEGAMTETLVKNVRV